MTKIGTFSSGRGFLINILHTQCEIRLHQRRKMGVLTGYKLGCVVISCDVNIREDRCIIITSFNRLGNQKNSNQIKSKS